MNAIFCLTFSLIFNYCESWKIVGDNIQTKWAKQVDTLKVWPEYPRPQLVRKDWVNLNGLWDFAIVNEHLPNEPVHYDGQILVPFCVESALSGVMKVPDTDQVMWYRRLFKTNITSNEKLILNFGAVDYESHVFVNGHPVGDHVGGYNRFSYDISKFIITNKENSLVIKVIDKTDRSGRGQPIGKQRKSPGGIMYTSTSGIWQTVWMERVPKIFVTELVITPDVDNESVDINVITNEPLNGIDIKIADKTGKVVASVANAVTNKINKIKINSPKLWSTTDPYLYDVHIKAGTDSVNSYVGLRKIQIKKDSKGINRFFLNGKPIFMYGTLDQGYWPDGIYTPPTHEAMVNDFLLMRKLGLNTVRKHAKVESDLWYNTADKMGFLVWQDFPQAFDGVSNETRAPADAKQIELEMETMVKQLHNYPSIIMWNVFNEGWGQYDTKRIVGLFRNWDPNRLINEASGGKDHQASNIIDKHGYVTFHDITSNPDRILQSGEYGAWSLLTNKEHVWHTNLTLTHTNEINSSKDYLKIVLDSLAVMRAHAMFGLGAAIITQLTDVEQEVNGLITYDRAIFKVDSALIAKEVHKLFPLETVDSVIFDAGHFSDAPEWFYTKSQPTMDNRDNQWTQIDYDSSHWSKGKAGFGGLHLRPEEDLVTRTEWTNPDIWLRKEFVLPVNNIPKHPVLLIIYDDRAQVYINGKQMDYVFDPYQIVYQAHDIDPKLLKSGKNVIAIHANNKEGGQGIDAGIYNTKYV